MQMAYAYGPWLKCMMARSISVEKTSPLLWFFDNFQVYSKAQGNNCGVTIFFLTYCNNNGREFSN